MKYFLYVSLLMLSFGSTSPCFGGLMLKNGMTIEMTVMPGKSYEKSMPLKNTSDTPLDVKIYQRDYRFNAQGKNYFDLIGTLDRSNGPWVAVHQKNLRVLPNEEATLPYIITVPAQVAMEGSYWSVIMLELVTSEGGTSGKPKQVLRYAVQIITHMGTAEGESDLAFSEVGLGKEAVDQGGVQWLYKMDLENKGTRSIRPALWLELYDTQGNPVQKIDGGVKTVYPGTSVRFQTVLPNLPKGEYTGVVMADGGGDDNLFGAEVAFKIP